MFTRFSTIILILTAFLGGLIYMLHLFDLVTPANEVYARYCALGLFVGGVAFLGLQKAKNHKFSWDDIYKNNTLIVVSLTALLASLFLVSKISFYAIAIFAAASLMHFLYTRKFYAPPKFFYFIFVYGLLMLFGTIGTQKGFRFPDATLSFYVLPLSLCFFRLSKETLLRIGEFFFKTAILFMAICVLYWWFNFLHLDANLAEWIADKTYYFADMPNWIEQAKRHHLSWESMLANGETIAFSAYFFVTSWSYYYHPSFISLILFFGLITGFYLYHKKDDTPAITKFELILYIMLCFLVMILMESRIGPVGILFIVAATGLYYLKLKTKHFKTGLAVYLLLGCAALYVLHNTGSRYANDEIRDAYRRVAVSYIQDNFWWGSGYYQQRLVLEPVAEKMKDQLPDLVYPHVSNPIYYVHNQFLGNMVQFGIWGLIVLLAVLVAIAYYAIKNRSYLLQMMLCIMVLFMLIEEPLYAQAGIVRFFAFLVFFVAISEAGKKAKIENANDCSL